MKTKKRVYFGGFHPIRWKLSIARRSLMLRAGFFGLHLYFHSIEPFPNNISEDADTTGIAFYFMPLRIVPGESVRAFQWVRRENPRDHDWKVA